MLQLKKTDYTLEFGINRKQTQTDLDLPLDSNLPMIYKLADFSSMVHRDSSLTTYLHNNIENKN